MADVVVFLHDAQDPVESGLRLLGADCGVPSGRSRDDARQHGGFGQGQVLGVLTEVVLGCRLDPIGPAPEVDRVHVVAQNLVLAFGL